MKRHVDNHEDVKELLKQDEDMHFNIIDELDDEINSHKKCIEELHRIGDDLQEYHRWNTKLFTLLAISSGINCVAIAYFVLERIGIIK